MFKLRVYIASHYERLHEMLLHRAYMLDHDLEVTASWLTESERDEAKWQDGTYGLQDLTDIDQSHFLVAFTDTEPHVRGGLQHEIGYAMALDPLRVLIVGPRVNVFHQCLPDAHVFPGLADCVDFVQKVQSIYNAQGRVLPVLRPSNPISMFNIYNDTYLKPEQHEAMYENEWLPKGSGNRSRRHLWGSNPTTYRRYTNNISIRHEDVIAGRSSDD